MTSHKYDKLFIILLLFAIAGHNYMHGESYTVLFMFVAAARLIEFIFWIKKEPK